VNDQHSGPIDLAGLRRKYRLDLSSSVDVSAKLADGRCLLVPIGSTEQHGGHLPLGTDALCAETAALLVAAKVPSLVAPPICLGVSPQHANFAGTVSIPPSLLTGLIVELCGSLVPCGFKGVFLFNGHGGNTAAVENAAREVFTRHAVVVATVSYMHAILRAQPLPRDPKLARWIAREMAGHGGQIETSLVMAVAPSLVDMGRADLRPVGAALEIEDDIVTLQYMIEDKSETGAFGDVREASAARGCALWRRAQEVCARRIQSVLQRSRRPNG